MNHVKDVLHIALVLGWPFAAFMGVAIIGHVINKRSN